MNILYSDCYRFQWSSFFPFFLVKKEKEKVKLGWGIDNRNLKLFMHEQEVGPTFICSVLACSTKCMEASGCCTFSFFAFPHFSGSSIQLPLDTRRPEAQTHTHRHAYSVVRSSSAQLYTLWMIGLQCTHVQEKEKGGGVRASRIIYICVCVFLYFLLLGWCVYSLVNQVCNSEYMQPALFTFVYLPTSVWKKLAQSSEYLLCVCLCKNKAKPDDSIISTA